MMHCSQMRHVALTLFTVALNIISYYTSWWVSCWIYVDMLNAVSGYSWKNSTSSVIDYQFILIGKQQGWTSIQRLNSCRDQMNPQMSKQHILYEMNPRIQDQFSAGLNKWFILIIVNVTVSVVKSLYMNGRIEWIAYKWLFLLKYKWDIKSSSGNGNKQDLLYALIL